MDPRDVYYQKCRKPLKWLKYKRNPEVDAKFAEYEWWPVLEEMGRQRRKYKEGYWAARVYGVLMEIETARHIPQGGIIYIGYRNLHTCLRRRYNPPLPKLESLPAIMQFLEKAGLIRIYHAKPNQSIQRSGKIVRMANGYQRVIPIPEPPQHIVDIILRRRQKIKLQMPIMSKVLSETTGSNGKAITQSGYQLDLNENG